MQIKGASISCHFSPFTSKKLALRSSSLSKASFLLMIFFVKSQCSFLYFRHLIIFPNIMNLSTISYHLRSWNPLTLISLIYGLQFLSSGGRLVRNISQRVECYMAIFLRKHSALRPPLWMVFTKFQPRIKKNLCSMYFSEKSHEAWSHSETLLVMEIPVVEFSREGHTIRKVFG